MQSLLDRDVERTPKWKRDTPPPQKPAAPNPSPDTTGLAGLFAVLAAAEEDRPRRFKPIEPKAKIKTRRAEAEAEEVEKDAAAAETVAVEELPVFFGSKVDSRSAGVFDVLFHKPGAAGGGEVKWAEFLYAMTSVGFQSEKLYGSVWQFSPSTSAAAGLEKARGYPNPRSRTLPQEYPSRLRRPWAEG